MKKLNIKNLFVYFSICILVSCSANNNKDLTYEKEEFTNGSLYHIKKGDSLIIDMFLFSSGKLSYISNYPKDYKQTVFYHKKTGVIESKLKIDTIDAGNTFGRAYYFFEDSGNLSSDYNYENGLKTGSAVSYHDSTDRIKSVMLYNDKGEMYYRKTFDLLGNHVKTEGNKD